MNKSCQRCNQSNPPEATFCLNCASPLAREQSGGGWHANQQQNQSNFGGQQAGQNVAQPSASNQSDFMMNQTARKTND